ncbi:MAG: hypothetical protein AB7F64_07635 [Gammaproteobacteria bacterium]
MLSIPRCDPSQGSQLKKLILTDNIDANKWQAQLQAVNSDFDPNDPRNCYIFPDNYPDSALPEDQLHSSNNRGGLAAFLRPKKHLGKNGERSIYDIEAIGVPTLSYAKQDEKFVPLTEEHAKAAFRKIFRKIGEGYIIHIPYNKNGEPAFGGGVAAKENLDPAIKSNAQTMHAFILAEFKKLEKFCTEGVLEDDDYTNALREGKKADRNILNAHRQLAQQEREKNVESIKPSAESSSIHANKQIKLLDIYTVRSFFSDDKYTIVEEPYHYQIQEKNAKTKFDVFGDRINITDGNEAGYELAIRLALRLAQKSRLKPEHLVITIKAHDEKTLILIQTLCYKNGISCNPENLELKASLEAEKNTPSIPKPEPISKSDFKGSAFGQTTTRFPGDPLVSESFNSNPGDRADHQNTMANATLGAGQSFDPLSSAEKPLELTNEDGLLSSQSSDEEDDETESDTSDNDSEIDDKQNQDNDDSHTQTSTSSMKK